MHFLLFSSFQHYVLSTWSKLKPLGHAVTWSPPAAHNHTRAPVIFARAGGKCFFLYMEFILMQALYAQHHSPELSTADLRLRLSTSVDIVCFAFRVRRRFSVLIKLFG